jgi:hypothetical protein
MMRQRAQTAGTLQSTPQEAVDYDQGNIELQPVNPQVVYVPAYNPWSVYGEPVSPYPGFSLLGALGSFLGSSPVSYGLGLVMTAFTHMPWGWLGWGLSWLTQSLLFHGSSYSSHSSSVANWGFPHSGMRAFASRGSMGRGSSNYNRMPVNYSRSNGGYNARGAENFARQGAGYTGNREAYNRGYQSHGAGSARQSMQAYNRTPQSYSRPAYGSGNYGRSAGGGYGSSFYGRSSGAYGGGTQAYRSPESGFDRGNYERSAGAYRGNSFGGYSGKEARSGGFHPFGGGHSSKSFYGGGKAPKAPKAFRGGGGGGHSHFGGHSGGHGGGGGHHHFL